MARTRNLDPGRELTLRYASTGVSRHGKPLVYACLLLLVGSRALAQQGPPCVDCQVLSISAGQVAVLPARLKGTRILVRSGPSGDVLAAVNEIRRVGGRAGVHFTEVPAPDDPGLSAEVDTLLGDASKARRQLGWAPEVGFEELVREMVESDWRLAQRDALVEREGFAAYKHHE